ncbi:hypothetical protein A6770_38255 [Nostoc minutum NIES-26]|uniref:Uncharacterized protein n=1 Tax=Nostoc minutum NIES-26 TaxID=1844469 RepID=A0A367RVW0_9NOSO|nr:hypothetical protein A6770_38255 [Nostoc minutum NIES-26]
MLFNLNSDLVNSSTVETLKNAIQNAYTSLTNFAKRDDFIAKIQTAFGQAYDAAKVESLRQQWNSGDFSSLPNIEVRTGAELQGANAAYAGATNTIYFSQDFLNQYAGNVEVVAAVLIEEIGHSIDWKINTTDTPGDEGELFSALVRGVNLSQEQFQQMKQENDSVVLNLGGSLIQFEQNNDEKNASSLILSNYSPKYYGNITYSFITDETVSIYEETLKQYAQNDIKNYNIQAINNDGIKNNIEYILGVVSRLTPLKFTPVVEEVELDADGNPVDKNSDGISDLKSTGILRFMFTTSFTGGTAAQAYYPYSFLPSGLASDIFLNGKEKDKSGLWTKRLEKSSQQ